MRGSVRENSPKGRIHSETVYTTSMLAPWDLRDQGLRAGGKEPRSFSVFYAVS